MFTHCSFAGNSVHSFTLSLIQFLFISRSSFPEINKKIVFRNRDETTDYKYSHRLCIFDTRLCIFDTKICGSICGNTVVGRLIFSQIIAKSYYEILIKRNPLHRYVIDLVLFVFVVKDHLLSSVTYDQ